jgi:hypothetical protein
LDEPPLDRLVATHATRQHLIDEERQRRTTAARRLVNTLVGDALTGEKARVVPHINEERTGERLSKQGEKTTAPMTHTSTRPI